MITEADVGTVHYGVAGAGCKQCLSFSHSRSVTVRTTQSFHSTFYNTQMFHKLHSRPSVNFNQSTIWLTISQDFDKLSCKFRCLVFVCHCGW